MNHTVKNHKHLSLCADLTQLSPEKFRQVCKDDFDVIVGGPPCQGFSIAGKRDKNDPRNSLFMEYVKYLDYYRPKIFLFENVMGILSMKLENGKLAIDIIMSFLSKNYNCIINKLYVSDFGVPQNRRRVIIIGGRKDLNIIPKPITPKTDRIPVSTVLLNREDVPQSYYLSEKAIQGILTKKLRMENKSYGFGAQFLDLNKPSFTIPARYWKDGYDDAHIRKLTELELKRIQTFPDSYELCGSKKEVVVQIGNAVPCMFAYHLEI